MSLLKRLSDGFWSYVSPRKDGGKDGGTKTTPVTVPRRQHIKPQRIRRASLEDQLRDNTSMDALDRVDSWKDRSPDTTSTARTKKRKYPSTPSTSAGRGQSQPKKIRTMDYVAIDNVSVTDTSEDVAMLDSEDGDDILDLSSAVALARIDRSPTSQDRDASDYEDSDSDIDLDTTLVVSEEAYTRDSPAAGRRKIISPTAEQFSRGVDTEELRAHGWDDDHITLMQKLAMRGFEPLLPAYWKFDYSFMPDALFSDTDDAFISSVRGDHFRAIGALEKLLELSGRVRDRVVLKGTTQPEHQSCRQISDFMRWAEMDAQLDDRTSIPIVVLEHAPADTPAALLEENARRKCAQLAQRWRDAFRVTPSIEASPSSTSKKAGSAQLAYPIPTLYAFIASGTLVALTAYSPADENSHLKSAAFFDSKDRLYDVWNSLAIAIVVCHATRVQMRIAEETGVGLRPASPGSGRSPSDDPDA